MNDFLRNLNPTAEKIGLLRVIPRTCQKHGSFEARVYGFIDHDGRESVTGEMGCRLCADERDRQEIMQGYARTKLLEMTGKIGIAARFAECTFDNYTCYDSEMETTLGYCKALASGHIPSVALCGPTERGKTHLMVSTLKEAVRQGRSAMFVSEAAIYRDIRETFLQRKDSMTENQVIAKYSTVQVLGIDEIGRSSWTDHEARILGEIVNNRSNNLYWTILATNLFPRQLKEYFDDAIYRKLAPVEILAAWDQYSKRRAV